MQQRSRFILRESDGVLFDRPMLATVRRRESYELVAEFVIRINLAEPIPERHEAMLGMIQDSWSKIDNLVGKRVVTKRTGKVFPCFPSVFGSKHTVIVNGHHRAVPHRANRVQVHLVTFSRLVALVELRPMRQRDESAALAIFRLHAIAQVERFGPRFAAILAAQHDAIRHVGIRLAATGGLVTGNPPMHDNDRVVDHRRNRPAEVIAIAHLGRRQTHRRELHQTGVLCTRHLSGRFGGERQERECQLVSLNLGQRSQQQGDEGKHVLHVPASCACFMCLPHVPAWFARYDLRLRARLRLL